MSGSARWTASDVARLEHLWLDEGCSKGEIADSLGRSREAVKNKIFQLRLLRGSKPGPSPWSMKSEAELRRLWQRGDGVAEIAEAIGVSVSSVLAKARRMDLPRRRPVQLVRRRPVESASPWFGRKPKEQPEPVCPRRPPALPEPESRNIPFIDLPPAACKWIAGDNSPWLACGHPTGHPQQPWCPYHAELVRWQGDTGDAIADTGLAA